MAFWGVEVKPGKPITHSCEKAKGRLRISQATLGISDATKKSVVQCNVGNRRPVLLCALLPYKTESCHLDLEFEEADDVVFSVIGPRSVYLAGYYLHQSQKSNPHSDTESYGMDIENTQTEGSSYCSDDDKYEDSFIDDVELQASPPSPVLSSKALDDTVLENNKPKDRKVHGKQLRERNQVIESDNDATRESEDEDGYLLSVIKSKRALKTTISDAAEDICQISVKMNEKAEDGGICCSQFKEKVDILDIRGKPEREVKMPWDDKGTQVENETIELPKEVESLEEIVDNNEKLLTDDKVNVNKAAATIINQICPVSNGKDCSQSLDLHDIGAKPKKKRKKHSKSEEKTCEIETDKDHSVLKEDKAQEVEASTNLDIDANFLVPSLELSSENNQKSKKRRTELQLKATCAEEIGGNSHNIPKDDEFKQGLLYADSTAKDLLVANGEHQEQQIDNQPEKKIKKKAQKKTRGEGSLKMTVLHMTDNQESPKIKYENQAGNVMHIKKRTLSNGLIIEEVANGPPDGKIAALGKKVKVYYTGMLKESEQVFDSNVGSTACNFRLGDEEFIDGWNVGIDGMRVGDKRRLTVPPSMGFGNHGVGENVPPNSWLVYDIELVGVRR